MQQRMMCHAGHPSPPQNTAIIAMCILRSQLQENMAQKAKGDGSRVVAAGYN